METLEEYTRIAEKLINKYGQSWMMDDEYIGLIVHNLIKSDIKYNDSKGTSIRTYRYGGFLFSMNVIYKKRKERQTSISLDNPDFNGDSRYEGIASTEKEPSENLIEIENFSSESRVVRSLINSKELTNRERQYLTMIYIDGISRDAIAKQFNISRQAVSYLEQRALTKLKEIYA